MKEPGDSSDWEELYDLERILEASRNKLKALLDGLTDPIVSITPEGKVESLNMAAANLMGKHPRDLVGMTDDALMDLADVPLHAREAYSEVFRDMMDLREKQFRLVEISSAEGPLFFEMSVVPVIDEEGTVTLGIIHIRDVTAFKRMERTIREYSHSLEEKVAERTGELVAAHADLREEKERLAKANEDLRHLEQLRNDLTNMMVHDMKGPLAAIMGNLDMLSYEPFDDTQMEILDLARMASDDLLRMIMNLLDIDRLEEGRLQLRPEPLRFAEVAGTVRDMFKTQIRLQEVQVQVEDRSDGPFPGDRELMLRVVQNLLKNALSHTPEGGRILMRADEHQDGSVQFEVRDTGVGIPEEVHHRIFKKFMHVRQGQESRTSTGLGLTFCKMAVEAHGGKIWFESEEGKGATFFIRLPRQDV